MLSNPPRAAAFFEKHLLSCWEADVYWKDRLNITFDVEVIINVGFTQIHLIWWKKHSPQSARMLQHETGHLDGFLYLDRLIGRHARAAKRAVKSHGWGVPGLSWTPGKDPDPFGH